MAGGAHLKGFADARSVNGIRNPAMNLTLDALFAGDGERFPFEALRRIAGHGPLFDDMAKTTPGTEGSFTELLLVADMDESFDHIGVRSFGNLIGEGMDDNAALTENAFIDLRIVHVTSEAGKVPDEQTLRAQMLGGGGRNHLIEVIAGGGGRAGFMNVLEWRMSKNELVLVTIFFDDLLLLFDGSILRGAAAVPKISPDC